MTPTKSFYSENIRQNINEYIDMYNLVLYTCPYVYLRWLKTNFFIDLFFMTDIDLLFIYVFLSVIKQCKLYKSLVLNISSV